ncbi:MAG TPA: NUDIX domain-containing protein [Chitinophagaceae bacterium]|jgi:predicted NUDIX family NTP pyrophosphohydrolase
MPKRSAGLLIYRYNAENVVEVLLVHPGGPFFTKKDTGVWSIPKGEYEEGEDALEVAKRELEEETGNTINNGNFIRLKPVTIKSGKQISAWAVETDFEKCFICSNNFDMEWPPKSGKMQSFAEVDKADWFSIKAAKEKINQGQLPLLDELVEMLKK